MKSLFAICIAVLVLSACAPAAASTPIPTVDGNLATETEQVALPTVTLIADLVPIQTYTEPHTGFEFDFPLTWTINALPDVLGSTVTIHSWDPATLGGPRPQGEGLPEGGEKMDIMPLTDFGVDYAHAMDWFREGNAGHNFTEEQVVLPTGAPGVLIRFDLVEGEPQSRCLITEVNHTAMMLCGAAWEFHYFESIAFSIRPTQ